MRLGDQHRRQELLQEVREKFSAIIGAGVGRISVHHAARILNVSRQTIHRYLNGEVIPRAEVLLTASQQWGLVWQYRDVQIAKVTSNRQIVAQAGDPVQLGLFDRIEPTERLDTDVVVTRKPVNGVRLSSSKRFRA